MTTAGKNFTEKIIMLALVLGVLQSITGSVRAQSLTPASYSPSAANQLRPADSAFTIKSGLKSGVNNGSNPANYKLNLSNGLSIRAGGTTNFLSAWNSIGTTNSIGTNAANSPDPTAFRRGNLIPHEVLFDAQHFTLGASYNYGLNNMWHSGFSGASKNPGLSLHAGFSF
jgi:hypothetical protein